MAHVPGFKNDILISYAHLDNSEGWVDTFHQRLKNRLAQIGLDEVVIWRDNKLQGTDVFSDEIFDHLKSTALLVSVISPRGVRSNWCQDERQKFEQFAESNGGLRIGNAVRAVKVVKTPLDQDAHRELWGTLGFEFYRRDEDTKQFREFDFSSPDFKDKLDELAQTIREKFEVLRSHPVPKSGKPAVYVALASSDLDAQRGTVIQQIKDWGYPVAPATPLPPDVGFRAAVESAMTGCTLSVHLISKQRGAIPEDEDHSIIALQYEIARSKQLDRIVWILPDHQPDPGVAQCLEEGAQKGVERLEGRTLEDLKDVIEVKLKRLSSAAPPPKTAAKKINVYLVCDRIDHPFDKASQDRRQVLELKSYLDNAGFVVWLPPVNAAEEKQRRKDHRETLKLSHAVVLYWGAADETWFRENLRELSKARAQYSSRRLMTEAIYFSRPPAAEKEQYRNHLDIVIEQFDQFRPEALTPLLQRLCHTDEEAAS